MWVLRRASRLALHVPELSDPERYRARRHARDWLRVELWDGAEGFPHWCHTHRSEEAEAAQEDDSEYTSDSDDSVGDPFDNMCYQCPFVPTRRHPSAAFCRCADNR